MHSFSIRHFDAIDNKLVYYETSNPACIVSLIQQLDENSKPLLCITCLKPDKTRYESLDIGKGNQAGFRVLFWRYEGGFKEHLILQSSFFRGFRLSAYSSVGFMDMNRGWYLHPFYEIVTVEKAIEAACYFFNHGTIDRKRHWGQAVT
jgi:hypothetical protein